MRGKILLGACLAAAMALAVAAISPTVEPARAGPAGQGAAGSPAEGRPTPILTITPQQARTLFGGKAAKMILHYGPGRDPFPDGRSSPVFLLDFNRPQLEFEFVCDDARSGDGDPVISPDGTRVAYNDHGKIYVRRLAKDGPEKTYIADGFEQRWWFHPKTGNQYVIYADRRSSLGDNVQGTTSMRKLKTGTCEPAEEAKVLLKDLALNGGRSPDGRYICSTLPGCLIVELTDPLAVENATAKVLWSTGRMCNGTISQDPKRSGIFLYEDPGHNRLICCPGANHINDIPPPAGWRQMEWAEWSTHPDYLSASPSKEDDWENPDKHSGWIYQFSTGQWTQVADHVRDTHLWVAQGKKGYSDSSNISAGLTTKFYGGFAKRLDQGGPVKPILEELNRIAAGAKEPDKAAEAKAILDHVDEWAKGELERAKGLETSNPAGAEKAYKSLVVRFNGLEPAKAAQERLQDKQFQEDLKSWAFVEQMQAAEKRLKDVPGAQCSAKDVKFARINVKSIERWVQVTHNTHGDYWADTWIKPAVWPPAWANTSGPTANEADSTATKAEPDRTAQVFVWTTGSDNNQIIDPKTGAIRQCMGLMRDAARYGRNFVMDLTAGAFVPDATAKPWLEAVQAGNAFAVEAVLTPLAVSPSGEGVVLAFADDLETGNLVLSQRGDMLSLRLKGRTGDPLPLVRLPRDRASHVVVSYAPGKLAVFVNGQRVLLGNSPKVAVSSWTAQQVIFGDAARGGRNWPGLMEGIGLFGREIGAAEARQRFEAYQARSAGRKATVELAIVEAKLTGVCAAADPQGIAPYKRCLSVQQFEVVKTIEGKLADKVINVAQWSVLDGRVVPEYLKFKAGETYRLALERWADHPEQESERMISGDFEEKELFYQVRELAAPAAKK